MGAFRSTLRSNATFTRYLTHWVTSQNKELFLTFKVQQRDADQEFMSGLRLLVSTAAEPAAGQACKKTLDHVSGSTLNCSNY